MHSKNLHGIIQFKLYVNHFKNPLSRTISERFMCSGWSVNVYFHDFRILNLLYVVTNTIFMSPIGRKTCDQWKAAFAAKDQGSSQGLCEIICLLKFSPLHSVIATSELNVFFSLFRNMHFQLQLCSHSIALYYCLLSGLTLSSLLHWIVSEFVKFKNRVFTFYFLLGTQRRDQII